MGSPKLVSDAAHLVCLNDTELAALRVTTKVKIAQNNDLTNRKC